jgi:hypothetical protein
MVRNGQSIFSRKLIGDMSVIGPLNTKLRATAQSCRQYGGEQKISPRQRYFRDVTEMTQWQTTLAGPLGEGVSGMD